MCNKMKSVIVVVLIVFYSPSLTWRDMQHIVVITSRTEPLRDAYWIPNAVGRKGIIGSFRLSYVHSLRHTWGGE